MRVVAGLVLAAAAVVSTSAVSKARETQDALAAQVDGVFADIGPGDPGCAVGVYREGRHILTRTYGLANVEDGRRITARTTFNLGSAAKPFTAYAALLLEERGRLSLDDDVRKFVPELPDYGKPIRIRDLLQHTSGLRDYGTLELIAGRGQDTMPELMALLARQERLNFVPGTRHEYSHTDFVVLSLVIERIVKEPFGAFLEREVLQPLGMKGSRVHDARGVRIPERAYGHDGEQGAPRLVMAGSRITGGENVFTSVEDLFHWDTMLARGVAGNHPLLARMLTRPSLPGGETIPYAFGLRLGRHRGLRTVARSGHAPGMFIEFIHFAEQRFGVATLCNAEYLYAGIRGQRVAGVYLNDVMGPVRQKPLPPLPPETPISQAELEKYVGVYRSPGDFSPVRMAMVDGKLAELLIDNHQTMTFRGGGLFTGDGSPGDFRLQFTPIGTRGMRLEFLSEGENVGVVERTPEGKAWRPSASDLAAYAGTYFSQELDAVWQLGARNGDLVIRRPGGTDALLLPMERDVFSRGHGNWREPLNALFGFKRDASGRVTHISITTPPGDDVVRDLRFVKVRGE
jgi:CubicO group peptidase (beta-lactamase class C family)